MTFGGACPAVMNFASIKQWGKNNTPHQSQIGFDNQAYTIQKDMGDMSKIIQNGNAQYAKVIQH
jgi:hypothetical protein